MLSVGLTGGIACGKTVVRRRLDERGVPTLDADAVVHALFASDGQLARALKEAFGDRVLRADATVDRKILSQIVFADSAARHELERIVHPRVYDAIEEFLDAARTRAESIAVVDAALMIETGSYEKYDRVVVVHCTPAQQLDRLMTRDGLTRADAIRRIQSQRPIEEKLDYADFLIDTSGTVPDTIARTDEVLEALRRLAAG